MVVRRDKVQLDIEFITDESRALAKANTDTKALTRELRKAVKEGGDVADVMRRIEEAGASVADIDLTKVAPKQLVTRARQLKQVLDQLPSSSPRAAKLGEEYRKINNRLAEIRKNSRGVASGGGGGGLFASLSAKATGFLALVTGALAAVRGLFNFASQGVQRAAAFEQLNVSLEVFLGSAEKAEQVIKDLNEFSIATPFETDQVNKAGRALLAFGFEQENLIPILEQVGNVAAGTGKDFNELALIFGKARAAGRIQGEELNQLAEAGIPIYDELAKVLGVNATEIRKLGEQGQLSFENLQSVFANLTAEGGQFNGLLEKQSTTLAGLASTARGAFGALQRNIGEAFAPLLKTILPPVIGFINRLIERVGPLAQAFGQKLVQGFLFVRRAVQPLIDAGQRLFAALSEVSTAGDTISRVMRVLGAAFTLVSNIVAGVVQRIAALFEVFSFFGGGEGGLINKVLTSPMKFLLEALTQVIAVLNGLVSVSGVVLDELKNFFGIFTDSIGLAIDKVKGFFGADTERAVFEGEKRLAARFSAAGKRIGGAFRKGYEDALGEINIPEIETIGPTGGGGGGSITNPLAPKPPTEAELKKAAEERARIEAEIARRAKNAPVDELPGLGALSSVFSIAGFGGNEVDSDLADQERAQENADRLNEISEQRAKREREILEKEAEFKEQLRAQDFNGAKETLGLVIGLLGRDEEARKKNALAIKVFQAGQAGVAGLAELQQIRLGTAAQIASASALGPVGLALVPGIKARGFINSALAITRTAINVGKIAATKFARGGTPKFGVFGGRSHAAGGNRGVFEDGTQIEVERDETFAIVNKNARGLLGFLSNTNAATGGVPFFNQGGIALPSTTPVIGPETAAAVPGGGVAAMTAVAERFERAARSVQNIRANVVFTDIEDASSDLNAARNAAEV